ncbi:MAG TPA: GAF domain-containing sensor histidine kinase [Kofleriaceae bacterium]|nr:GAF domain-containing sensor histidine kinase [Kofleriaceae bacterium]
MTVSVRDITEQQRIELEQRVLADAGAALVSLDYEEALHLIARVAVRALADFAVLFVVEEGGEPRRVATASRDPALTWCMDTLMVLPPPPRAAHPIWEVLETRTSQIRELAPERYEALAESPEHLRSLRAARPRSSLSVPLLLAGQCVGVLYLTSSTRWFEQRDLCLAEELARRCALFIENARLHRAERRAIQARDEMLAIVAHDLRNPLNSIVLHSELLRAYGAESHPRSREPIDAIVSAAKRMNRIIEDLLDVTRSETGHLAIERARIPAGTLVTEVVATQRPQVATRALELRLDLAEDLPDVWADPDRISQVFENLVGNSMKFTTGGRISIGAAPQQGEVRFWVADTGSGIPPQDLPYLFDRFWQARKTRSVAGLGLGLAIAKGIVEAHDGRIWVESQVGVGSTFFFTLPIAAGPEPARAAAR